MIDIIQKRQECPSCMEYDGTCFEQTDGVCIFDTLSYDNILERTRRVFESKNDEPSEAEIRRLMNSNNLSYYTARERLRELAYGGKYGHEKSPYQSWGDFWKSR